MGSLGIDWRVLLTPRASFLVRLDLSQTPLDCAQLGHVLLAASTTCPLVRILALPMQTPTRFSEDNEAREANLNELYGALQRWHRTNGGLLHLRIPFGRFDENTAVRLLRSLVAYCPDIEYVDGWLDTYRLDADAVAHCDTYWPAPVVWWRTFWRGCTKLRAFNTVVMPFDDEYVRVCRPSVESLVITIDSVKARHFEVSRDALWLLARNMPRLQHLRLEIPFVRREVWDPRECIDDGFVQAVADGSPLLRELRIQCPDERVLFQLTAHSVRRLAQLPHVEVVELQRLEKFEAEMVTSFVQRGTNVQLAYSFASGHDDAWNLLRYFADASEGIAVSTTGLSLSLWSLCDGGGHGIRHDEVACLVERLTEDNIDVHVHTTKERRCDQLSRDQRVDLVHLELNLATRCAHSSTRLGKTSATPAFAFPTCSTPACSLQIIVHEE